MKKLLVALLLIVSSVLSFGAEKVSYEKLSFSNGYIYYNNQEFTGEFEKKDPNTRIVKMVASVKNGKLHGMSYTYDEVGKVYYKSGVLSAKLTYKNDEYEGVQKYYYENGKLQTEIPTSQGVVTGAVKLYDKRGRFEGEMYHMMRKKL